MRIQLPRVLPGLLLCTLAWIKSAQAVEECPFEARVLDVRPRIFLRAGDDFDGLTIEKLRRHVKEPEFKGLSEKWRSRPLGRAILWMIDGREEDLDAAIAGLEQMDAGSGTWSDRGLDLLQLATLFDWLYEELGEPTRTAAIAKIERAADEAVAHVRGGRAPFFYSRTPGALAGLCVAGLALDGASGKADHYLDTFRKYGVGEYFKAYEWVDGAATGATYTLNYTYVDLPSIAAAWWSATGCNPADWIREHQGAWLDDIVRFYLWYMRPGFAFTDINDQFRGNWQTHDEFCQGLDIATYVTRDGYGRAWSQRWLGRFGSALYHRQYAHNLIFRDPTIPARPLTELPSAALFGRESCGYGFFRSGWPAEGEPDTATHVFFRCGDPMDVHGGVAAGEFQVFKYAPLAARSGRYGGYDSPPDQYHRNCISANVVLFLDPGKPDDRGDQNSRRGLKTDHATWAEWLDIRNRNGLDVAKILDWQVGPDEARCRADLSKTNPDTKCRLWIRELVWLTRKHLLVLDVIETAEPEIRRLWQLHLPNSPELGERVVTVANGPPDLSWADERLRPAQGGRLFCRTLLPQDYSLVLHCREKAEAYQPSGQLQGPVEENAYHRQFGANVIQIDPGVDGCRTVFLHVLTAADSAQTQAPRASCRMTKAGRLQVLVEGSSTDFSVPTAFVETRE